MTESNFSTRKSFDKSYVKLLKKQKDAFKARLMQFLENPNDPILRNHSLSKEWKGFMSFDVTGDLRAIYYQDSTGIVLVEIGTHSQLYG